MEKMRTLQSKGEVKNLVIEEQKSDLKATQQSSSTHSQLKEMRHHQVPLTLVRKREDEVSFEAPGLPDGDKFISSSPNVKSAI